MFGVYSAIMVVLVNMLIAMMSNSYQKIAVSLKKPFCFHIFNDIN